MAIVGGLAAFVPARVAGEMTSIGTLFAFTLVCAAVLIVRKSMPDVHRAFKTPFVPTVPILGILTCLCMMLFLPADTWIRLVLWMLIGLDVYACYGVKHSKLEHNVKRRQRTHHIEYGRNRPVCTFSYYRIMASTDCRLGGRQDIARYFVRLCVHTLCILYGTYLETDIRKEEVSVFYTLSASITFIHCKG